MLPGPNIIIACPQCGALAQVFSLASGNTFDATFWTDGYMDAPMLPNPPEITRCHNCAAFFWVKRARKIGEIPSPWDRSFEHRQPDKPFSEAWLDAPEIRELSEAEYLEAIADGLASNSKQECLLRTHAWWAGNDRFRDLQPAADESLAPAARANLERLITLLKDTTPDDRLMKAEATRELGQFDQAIALLSVPFSEEYDFVARYILDLAQRGVSVVRKIPSAIEEN